MLKRVCEHDTLREKEWVCTRYILGDHEHWDWSRWRQGPNDHLCYNKGIGYSGSARELCITRCKPYREAVLKVVFQKVTLLVL